MARVVRIFWSLQKCGDHVMWPFSKKTEDGEQRRALKTARMQARRKNNILRIIPPEGVPLDIPLATIGQRIGAQLTDFGVTLVLAILIVILTLYAFSGFSSWFTIIAALTFFFIRVPYYIWSELSWNGRTLAKRWFGLRVISADGRSLSAHQIVTRNLMKEVEFFAPLTYVLLGNYVHWSIFTIALVWVVVLLIVPWRSKRNQRIGDIIANTVVIMNPKPHLLRDMAKGKRSSERFIFTTQHLDQYGSFELQVLEKILRAPPAKGKAAKRREEEYLKDIAERIIKKISYPEKISRTERGEFLNSFYTAQRAHLENKKLFGDSRKDKFFNRKNDSKGDG